MPCSKLIKEENVISAKIMHKKGTGKETYFSYKEKNPFFKKKNKQKKPHTFIN